jgi:hypothetical protein
LEDLGVDGRVLLKCIFKKWDRSMYWFDLGMDTHRCRTVVNGVMNLRVSKMQRIFRLSWNILASQEGLCSMELIISILATSIKLILKPVSYRPNLT